MSNGPTNGKLISPDLPVSLRLPAIVGWNRLEPRPRSEKFERSLRVEVRDALWMLTRQWQLGEFKGEDAGTVVSAKIQLETTQITRYAQRGGKAVAYDPGLPLETRVEREGVPMDLYLRLQMGLHWFRLLRKSFGDDRYRELYRNAYPIEIPLQQNESAAEVFSNRASWQLRAAAAGRGMDGGKFHEDLLAGTKPEEVTAAPDLKVTDADKTAVIQAGQDFMVWYKRLFNQPQSQDDSAWAPQHLEYQFACSAPKPDGTPTVLLAEEYYHGHLDWYSFEVDPNARLEDKEGEEIDDDVIKRETFTFLPAEVRFAGMPNLRWWEFEDRRTDFGNIDAHTTDIAKLLFTEFGLIYGNDWIIIPYVVPVGSLCEIKGLAVMDTFGQRTLIRPAGGGEDEDWQRWTMFNLSTKGDTGRADYRLFLPPTISKLFEGSPLEKATFLRDEMANMVWAVESTISNDLGGGINGYEAATDLQNYLKRIAPAPPEPPIVETEAQIRYRLATVVPENWIPFIPIHVPGSNREIQLQRAAMPRAIKGLDPIPVRPRGVILRPGLGEDQPYFVHEEEVPRAGAIVTRTYQRTRWHDGTTYIWLGRRKQNGRGEGSSGLKFDQIEPIERQTNGARL